jgi:MFS family permease
VITIASYSMLAFLEILVLALIPLIWSTPMEFGGLGLSPASIGLWLSVYGCMNGIFQFAVFPRVIERFGLRSVLVSSIVACAVVLAMFPLENFVLRHTIGGSNKITWLLILLQLLGLSIHEMGFGTFLRIFVHKWTNYPHLAGVMYLYISSVVQNKRSLGAVNGLAQTMAAAQRTIGPAIADSLFAFSITNNILGGNFVYVVLCSLASIGLYIASKLPRHIWTHSDR